MSTSSVVRSRSPTNDSRARTSEKLAGMKTTKNAPTSESRLTTAVPPPNAASARTPEPDAIGIARVSATIAAIRRSSLTASRRSRRPTIAALRRSSRGQIMALLDSLGQSNGHMVVDYGEVDVLQRRELTDLLARLQARLPA